MSLLQLMVARQSLKYYARRSRSERTVGIVESARTLNVKILSSIILFLVIVGAAFGADLRIGTLNCYLLFDPAIDHRGKVDDDNRMTSAQYQQKLTNLATLTKAYNVVALQEIGGKTETAALAKAAGFSWAWTQGRDTATGQEVALLHNLPNWQVTSKGRVAELDRVVSKHLLVLATHEQERVYFLAVHLLRPIDAQQQKQEGQRKAIGERIRRDSRYPRRHQQQQPRVALRLWKRCWRVQWLYAHTSHKQVLRPSRRCWGREMGRNRGSTATLRPKANDANKRVWTDHYFVGATLSVKRD
jgi:hypothetical protein